MSHRLPSFLRNSRPPSIKKSRPSVLLELLLSLLHVLTMFATEDGLSLVWASLLQPVVL
jgi:hypothetical protein